MYCLFPEFRLTIHAVCPMKMTEYPMDRPVCPLIISGCKYIDIYTI